MPYNTHIICSNEKIRAGFLWEKIFSAADVVQRYPMNPDIWEIKGLCSFCLSPNEIICHPTPDNKILHVLEKIISDYYGCETKVTFLDQKYFVILGDITDASNRSDVCSLGGSYTREDIWYNDTTNRFFIDQYHYGVIDDEEHFDGTTEIDTLTALKKMIKENKLRAVLMYQNELNLSRDLDIVLADLKKNSTIYDYRFLSNTHFKYYKISKDEYAIYYEGTFFFVKDNEQGTVDFSVVRRILENYKTVTYYEVDMKGNWVSSNIMDVSWL